MPAAARPATVGGAEEFTRYWIAQLNAALKTADPGSISAVSATECPVCGRLADEARELKQHGQRAGADVWAVESIYAESFDGSGAAVVISRIHQQPVSRLNSDGTAVSQYVERTDDFAFTLAHDGRVWRTQRLQVVK